MKTNNLFAIAAIVLLAACTESAYKPGAEFKGTPVDSESVAQNIIVRPVENLPQDFIMGVDISMLAQIEECGGVYYNEQGKADDIFNILKANGVNWVRLRIWNKPTNVRDVYADGKVIAPKGSPVGGGNNSVEQDIKIARRAKKAGMKILLDFHYSDFWADPGKQNMPQEWRSLNADQLNKAVEEFTRKSLEKFVKAGIRPDMVQIGNELNGGFMWPMGKIWKSKTDTEIGGMEGFIRLLKSASSAVRRVQGKGSKIKIVIHLADGGDQGLYRSIFDPVTEAGVDFDVIGLSFYNYWHGSMQALKANMEQLHERYGKEMIVAETAYGFTEADADGLGNNFTIYSDNEYGYNASVQGQATVVRDVIETVASVPGGSGVFYWEPDWIPAQGAGWRTGEGSSWENQAMFDFNGRVLPSMAVWNLVYGRGEIKNVWGGSAACADSVQAMGQTDSVSIVSAPGQVPELPASLKIAFSDGSQKLVNVTWNEYDWKHSTKETSFTLGGTVSGTDIPVQAEVTLTTRLNLIKDPSWESGTLGKWKLSEHPEACFAEDNIGNAHSGNWTYKYWLDSPFQSELTQTFTGLKKGTYEFSLWAMGGGGENSIEIFAITDGGKRISAKVTNTGWKNWKQYSVEIPCTGGEITVGIALDSNSGCWGNFDDAELILK